jgi:acyl-coenzyme A thioesterase PaaI-like protein
MGASPTYRQWQKFAGKPLGSRLFSAALTLRVPYFRTILPHVVTMEPGHCVVTAPKWWGVHNHIGTFHAIAVCNLAEVAMGMLAEATVPSSHRWLPRGMTVEYTAKATTSLRADARLPELPEFGPEKFDLPVPVTVTDTAGRVVLTALITIAVSPKPAK